MHKNINIEQLSRHSKFPLECSYFWLSKITGLDWTTGLSLNLRACHYVNTYDADPEIVVGHWPFSDQFLDLAKQK